VARFLTVAVTAALVACVMFAQWLATFPVLPHAPLHDCRQHRCGCPAEVTARKACCCFAKSESAAAILQSGHCEGNGPSPSSTIAKLQWAVVGPDEFSSVIGPVTRLDAVTMTLPARAAKPPVPPPRFLLAV
jgi:hypothetical protein